MKRPIMRTMSVAAVVVAGVVTGGVVSTLGGGGGVVGGGRPPAGAARAAHLVSAAIFQSPQLVPVSSASAVSAASGSGSGLPADCIPQPGGPPSSSYQLGLVGTASHGVLDTGTTRVANISVKFCAVVTLVNGTPPCAATGSVVSPQDGQVFGSLSATLTLIPDMSPVVPFKATPGTISGGFSCSSSTNGLAVSLDATVSGTTGLFGLSCTIGPFTVPLSGVLTGPVTDASITLKGNDFVVPGVSASSRCPGNVPAGLDTVAGLPISRGQASLTLPATVSLYRPPAP